MEVKDRNMSFSEAKCHINVIGVIQVYIIAFSHASKRLEGIILKLIIVNRTWKDTVS